MRIVSLLPSATEIVCSLGLQDQLVGVSHECDYPPGVEKLPRVTATRIPPGLSSEQIDTRVREHLNESAALYSLNMAVLEQLHPDLIVTQALCDVCAVAASEVDAAACVLPGQPRVVNLEPMSLQDVFDTIVALGTTTGRPQIAQQVVTGLQKRVNEIREPAELIPSRQRPRVGFLEWIDPLFNAGHWTPELIAMAGGIDCFGNLNQPSTTQSPQRLVEANPDVLFVALCGFEPERTVQDLQLLSRIEGWGQLNCVRKRQLYYTDGNAYFSRPGPRLVDSLEILAHCLHPTRFRLPKGLPAAVNFAALL